MTLRPIDLPPLATELHRATARYKAFVRDALRNIDDAAGGWPADSTNTDGGGATPELDRGTSVERGALNKPDPARAARDQIIELADKADRIMRDLAATTQRWACWQIDGGAVQARLATIEASIWCSNCIRHGDHEPRVEGLDECEICTTLRKRLGRPAPLDLVDVYHRTGKCTETDVARWEEQRRRDDAERKERQRRETAERKRLERLTNVANLSTSETPA